MYQIAEANGQDILKVPGKPYSIFVLFLLVIPTAAMVAYWLNGTGLASYGMGFRTGWWKNYLIGVGIGLIIQAILELIGIHLGARQVSNLRFSWRSLFGGVAWMLFANFPAAAGEDLITRGYVWQFMRSSPLVAFIALSAFLYTLNHIIRLLTRPVTDWYHLPFLGVTLAYALYQTGSLWFVIGLHQAGNVILPVMRQIMDVANATNMKRRMAFGIFSEIAMFIAVALIIRLLNGVIG